MKPIQQGKILLFSPNMRGMKGGVNRIQPPLGIGYLAALLEKNGYKVYIRDTALEGYSHQVPIDQDPRMVLIGESDASISEYIKKVKPDMVGISILFSNLAAHAHQLAALVKKINPRIPVILGGNHVTNAVRDYVFALTPGNEAYHLPRELKEIQDPNVDYLMTGESDFDFLDFVQTYFAKKSLENIRGLVMQNDQKEVVFNHAHLKKERRDLKDLPHPARHLMNMEGYFKVGLFHSSQTKSNRILSVMASRGCPEKCSFCTTPAMWGSKVRWREPQDIYKEIKSCIKKYRVGEVHFEDDTLTAHKKYLLELCDLLEPLKIPWCTPNGTKINYHLKTQPQLFQRMVDAGCYQITLACESGVQRVLDHIIHKNLKIEQIKPAIKNAKEAGLFVHTFWIVGYPGETRQEMEETIRFAAESGADSFSVSILTPLPGTPIYRQVMKENLWWDSDKGIEQMIYRNSLIKVDGFQNPEAFEQWVQQQNAYLNSLLQKNNPQRAQELIKSRRGKDLLKIKQT
ncbi:MAG: B12-binding domain-containing radical SAM protein [Candidatus Omnitrophica bacterium]|nr:B12-binding domain-containing radical SAM protein [Candidatus Omnitrophota bacterium]